jgi:stage III sporulation protein AA
MSELIQLFPLKMRSLFLMADREWERISEIRLRCGLPVVIFRDGIEVFLTAAGKYTDKRKDALSMEREQIEEVLEHICKYSVYAYEDELRQGYLTTMGGHRIGVVGKAVIEGDGSIRTITHVSGLNIRVSHQVLGVADPVLRHLYQDGEVKNTLIISPPGCGKTTLLRDLVRRVSDGNHYGSGKSVGLVDERSEIAGSYLGIAQNDVGMRTDVLDACPKALGMMLLLRAMSPRVIAVDELGGEEDARALRMAASCGCKILATIHGTDLFDIHRKAGIQTLFWEELFDLFLILGKKNGKCLITSVVGKEDAYAALAGKSDGVRRVPGVGTMVSGTVSRQNPTFTYHEPNYGRHDERNPLSQVKSTGMLPQGSTTSGTSISRRL